MEGSELQVVAAVLLHDLVSQGDHDLNSRMGLLGVYDKAKGRWLVKLPEGDESMQGGICGQWMG